VALSLRTMAAAAAVFTVACPQVAAIGMPSGGPIRSSSNHSSNVYEWGDRNLQTTAKVPRLVARLRHAISISAGPDASYAVVHGHLWAWGFNQCGQLGDGTRTNSLTPVRVHLAHVERVSAGDQSAVAVTRTGSVFTWGCVGPSRHPQMAVPRVVHGLSHATAVASEQNRAIVLRRNGSVWTFAESGSHAVQRVKRLPPATSIAAGRGDDAYALSEAGIVYAFGGDQSALGKHGSRASVTKAVVVPGLARASAIGAGQYDGYAVVAGRVWSWGYTSDGALGVPPSTVKGFESEVPVQVNGVSHVTTIAGGFAFAIARTRSGRLYAWGHGVDGELGDGQYRDSHSPMRVKRISHVTRIAAGDSTGYATVA
jgi:alpha-tubulin suppressor-like RCC1 family protein